MVVTIMKMHYFYLRFQKKTYTMSKKQSLLVETWSVTKTTKGSPTVFIVPVILPLLTGGTSIGWQLHSGMFASEATIDLSGDLLKTSLPIISLNPG